MGGSEKSLGMRQFRAFGYAQEPELVPSQPPPSLGVEKTRETAPTKAVGRKMDGDQEARMGIRVKANWAIIVQATIALAMAIAWTGCAYTLTTYRAYSGPKRAQSEIGVLYNESEDVSIDEVDGKGPYNRFVPDYTRRILFLPGPHTLRVSYSRVTGTRTEAGGARWDRKITYIESMPPVTLSFDVKAGGIYYIRFREPPAIFWPPYIYVSSWWFRPY